MSKKIKKKIVRKTTYVSKGPEVTLRNMWCHKNSDVCKHMPRETEKPPLTMIDEKPTDGTSTSKKDQDVHGMMKSENFFQRGSVHTLPEPRRRIEEFFLSRWSWSDKCSFFLSLDFFLDRVFLGFRTHVVATTVCTTGGVHTLTCRTHIFLLHSLSTHIRTSSCVSHTRMAQGSSVCKKGVCVCVLDLSISLSPFSWFTRLPCCSCTVTSRPIPNTTSLLTPTSTWSCRTFPSWKCRRCATPHLHRDVRLPDQIRCKHRLWAQGVRHDHFRG